VAEREVRVDQEICGFDMQWVIGLLKKIKLIAVRGSVSARPRDAAPAGWTYGGLGRPSVPRYRTRPLGLRQLAIAHAGQIQPVT
jgi:hypothetical protein